MAEKPDIVEHDVDHARRPIRGLRRLERRPVGHRVPDIDVDRALKRLAHLGTPSARRRSLASPGRDPSEGRWPCTIDAAPAPQHTARLIMLAKVHCAGHHPPKVSPEANSLG